MKGHFTLPRSPELEFHGQMQLSVISETDFRYDIFSDSFHLAKKQKKKTKSKHPHQKKLKTNKKKKQTKKLGVYKSLTIFRKYFDCFQKRNLNTELKKKKMRWKYRYESREIVISFFPELPACLASLLKASSTQQHFCMCRSSHV